MQIWDKLGLLFFFKLVNICNSRISNKYAFIQVSGINVSLKYQPYQKLYSQGLAVLSVWNLWQGQNQKLNSKALSE